MDRQKQKIDGWIDRRIINNITFLAPYLSYRLICEITFNHSFIVLYSKTDITTVGFYVYVVIQNNLMDGWIVK